MRLASALLAAAALAISSAATTRAAPAPAEIPAVFYGMLPQLERPQEEYFTMKRGGVDTVRFPIPWIAIERQPGQYDFSLTDRYVERVARARMQIFPVLNTTPTFYGVNCAPEECFRSLPSQTAQQRAAWKAFVGAVVDRYGPRGSFWAQHPDVPKRAMRIYQIWNEENFHFFTEPRSPRLYAELVKISHATIKDRDPGARVILGGLFAHPRSSLGWPGQAFLKALYRLKGFNLKARVDGVALHPYATDAAELRPDINGIRGVMRQNGDARTPLYLTEIGWGDATDTAFEKGPKGQVRELGQAYHLLRRMQRSARIRSVFWFSWEDLEDSCNFCESTGLWTEDAAAPKPAWFRFRAFAGCFGRSATLLGTESNDRLIGTPGRDVIVADRGDDRIVGGGGRDFLCGGPGRDLISSGGGDDRVAGEQGNDRIYMRGGRDMAWGGRGVDIVGGSFGLDTLLGGSGRDRLLGAAGNDRLFGGNGNDVLLGAKGNDILRGGRGRDRLLGGSGQDRERN